MKKNNFNLRTIILLISVVLGIIVGVVFKEKAIQLRPLGTIFINLMFTIVVPLVFFNISSNIANMESFKRLGKILRVTFLVFLASAIISGLFSLISGLVVNPLGNAHITLETTEEIAKTDIGSQIVQMLTVEDFVGLFSRKNIIPLIIFSVLFGMCVNLSEKHGEPIKKILASGTVIFSKFINIIMYYAPIGLFAYFAALIGEYGPSFIGTYAKIGIMFIVVSILNVLIFHTLYLFISGGKTMVKKYYKNIPIVAATALSTQSSVATMPTNFNAVEKMKVNKDISNVSLPIGTVLHMEGSIIQSVLKIILLFSVFNIPFSGIGSYLLAVVVAVVTSLVSAGIPGGGVIGNMMLVSLYSFPATAFPIIVTIEWMLDAPTTVFNVIGDTACMPLIEKFVEKKRKKLNAK